MKREDILLMIASVVIAIGLWYQVQPMFEPGREREIIVALQLENKPEDLSVSPSTESVTLVASGTLADLDRLDSNKVTAYLDLKSVPPGDSSVPIQIREPANSNIQIRSKTGSVRITAEKITRSNRRVEIVTTGTPAEGLILASTVASPEVVELFGPTSNIEKVSVLRVTVDLAKLKPGQSITAPIAILDASGNPVPAAFTNPAKITVAASFTASTASRDLPIIVNWTGEPAEGYILDEITAIPNHLEATGRSEAVSAITTLGTVEINLNGIKESKQMTAKLVIPDGLQLKTTSVRVNIKIKKR